MKLVFGCLIVVIELVICVVYCRYIDIMDFVFLLLDVVNIFLYYIFIINYY